MTYFKHCKIINYESKEFGVKIKPKIVLGVKRMINKLLILVSLAFTVDKFR